MKQIIETQEEGATLLERIELNKKLITASRQFELVCQSKGWVLPDNHFDEREALTTEIKKLKAHYDVVYASLGKLKELI